MNHDVVKLESYFIDYNVTNTKVANKLHKLKIAFNTFNKTKLGMTKNHVDGGANMP